MLDCIEILYAKLLLDELELLEVKSDVEIDKQQSSEYDVNAKEYTQYLEELLGDDLSDCL